MQSSAAGGQGDLVNLLKYAEELLKGGDRIISDLSKHAEMVFYQHDVSTLEGVSTEGSDGTWLRVSRLGEIGAPDVPDAYRPWIAPAKSPAPFDVPVLADTLLVQVPIEEASDLLEAELALPEDVMKPLGRKDARSDDVDVLLRLENLAEFAVGFQTWLEEVWRPWEAAERPRRRSIEFYNKLFAIQQRTASMGDDVPVEVVFGVGLARWLSKKTRINTPLIEATVELELDPEDGSLVIQPRDKPPTLNLRPFDELDLDGIGRLQREAATQLDRLYNDPDVGFSPHQPTGFESVLRMCQARLSSSAIYEPDVVLADSRSPRSDDTLRISDTWVIYVRKRSTNFRQEDIRRLISVIENTAAAALPGPALQLTSKPTHVRNTDDDVDLGASSLGGPILGSPSTDTGSWEKPEDKHYFFPLPYNDDQIEIVRRLEQDGVSGVVVQGPPGTGKTHTIANIIAHYMATGRRVLVSAHEQDALSAIQDKMPESIRDLAITVIASDQEGGRQLERAVDILATQVKSIDKHAYNEERLDCERRLVETRAALAEVDRRIKDYALLNMTELEFQGEKLLPMALAAKLDAVHSHHAWFTDILSPSADYQGHFDEADIEEAQRIRGALGADLLYSSDQLPEVDRLPSVPVLLATHVALAADSQAETRSASGSLPYVNFGSGIGLAEARALLTALEATDAWARASVGRPWLQDLYRSLAGGPSSVESPSAGLKSLCQEWATLSHEGQTFFARGVQHPGVPFQDPEFDAAVDALADGRKPFGLFSFGKSALKSKIEAVRIESAVPADKDGWSFVRDFRAWQKRAQAFSSRWNLAARSAGFPPLEADPSHTELIAVGRLITSMNTLCREAPGNLRLIEALFPYGVDHQKVLFGMEPTLVREALQAAIAKEGHAEAHALRRYLQSLGRPTGEPGSSPFSAAIGGIVEALGAIEVEPQEMAEAWTPILEEARRLDGLRASRQRLEAIARAVASAGAVEWAAALLSPDADNPTPETWRDAWQWARANGHIRTLSGRDTLAVLSARRVELDRKQRELLGQIVRLRTFIGLKQNITERVASALAKFAMKVRQLGAGTGKSAPRHRRAIREAALDAAEAVPCWILPEWRVAEQLPSELAAFDLVIIDEASQSDITSLPTVLRGKKLLIVGDDKQVSPTIVSMEERTIVQLRETFLKGMDIANYLEPTTSLYDLAAMTFPGSVILLREHFRCAEPIIAFSSRFYPSALIPLRVPTAAERLDPPLVDIYVPEGRKALDVNEQEAQVILAEIIRLVEDPAFAHRSIGVVSLIGDKQAKRIQSLLLDNLGPTAFARHRIMCGNASKFQGQERDIMFLSMVACPKTVRAQTARPMEQRFNVALSRARDRMVLVRSVPASMLNPNDLKLAVIEHFRNPMGNLAIKQSSDVLEACDSDFERDVGKRLLDRGYRVRPQVHVGAYSIDFVIEGEGNRRLAVELDGDRYHPPEKWAADMHRQRSLERLGWVFWRCWGSHWLMDKQGCLDDLLATLERMEIRPVGGVYLPQAWTEHRVIGAEPLGAAAQEVSAASGHPVLATVNPSPAAASPAQSEPGGPEYSPESTVEVGDTVIVRFADDNRIRRFRLSSDANNIEQGIVHIGQPLGLALIGSGIEEEVDLVVDGLTRRVIIEKITKAA